jgi:hypothetical protein
MKLLLKKGAEKALLIILSSFRKFTSFIMWWNHMVIPKDYVLFTPS